MVNYGEKGIGISHCSVVTSATVFGFFYLQRKLMNGEMLASIGNHFYFKNNSMQTAL
ncbi:MAG: hypothetical protein WCX28_00705 [Bacteriovoracaceae bacterium]